MKIRQRKLFESSAELRKYFFSYWGNQIKSLIFYDRLGVACRVKAVQSTNELYVALQKVCSNLITRFASSFEIFFSVSMRRFLGLHGEIVFAREDFSNDLLRFVEASFKFSQFYLVFKWKSPKMLITFDQCLQYFLYSRAVPPKPLH